MKKNLFEITEEEKNRVLNLHETATKKLYLTEADDNTRTFYDDFGSYHVLDSSLPTKKIKEIKQHFENKYGVLFQVGRIGDRIILKPA